MTQKDRIKVLVTSAGSTNGVNVIKSLREQREIDLYIVAVDSDPLAAGLFMAEKHYIVPRADNSDFVSTIIKICKKEGIKIVIPTFSYELPFFARNKQIFDRNKIKMALSSYKTFSVTESKIKTSEYFEKRKIPFPKIYTDEDIALKKIKFPVIIKPIISSGSKGVVRVDNWDELYFFKKYIKNSFMQEFVEGVEYTIDGVSDLQGRMIAASPRIRLETKGGLAVKSVTVNDRHLVSYVKKIVEGLRIIGPFNVQCIKKGREVKFIEVNNRFPSGGLPLTVKAGLNIPLILVKLILRKKIKKPKIIRSNLAMTRYWDSIILEKIKDNHRLLYG